MSKHVDLGQYATAALGQYFELIPKDIGADAHLSKRGMTFDTKSCEIRDVGHLCVMRMNAFMGLMKMETIVISPTKVDMPLFNVDWVSAFGTETLIAELYDTQLEPWPGERKSTWTWRTMSPESTGTTRSCTRCQSTKRGKDSQTASMTRPKTTLICSLQNLQNSRNLRLRASALPTSNVLASATLPGRW